ncbi:MFS transporter [Pseudoteredinibacter isoporae]|uniref:Fucose permease n=1 Tax=Pseudoteredinibacter isoporae TaxID=570281 RepID=A0A7X0MVP2_9GAMM|nr:MFS transporter [Pseudoteredinibacter isoporae]MBB6520054.1 fucose permease [Pseudoteredinibacter isoporae]NHO85626.1 MFS transporter [Pseudoteredinibacter isoporae]NIB25922.1 MFS transporter [Pseudoteredinibacter isoporae]
MNSLWTVKLSLFINYFLFAMLLNSVGTVIFQVQNSFAVGETAASVIEAYKDLSIALTSFLIGSFITKIGYKRSMLFSLLLISACCLLIPYIPGFWSIKLLFAVTGFCFALVKVSTFACIALFAEKRQEHASFMNFLEAIFMVGVLSGYFLFSFYVDNDDPGNLVWLNVYFLLSGLALMAFFLLLVSPLDESKIDAEHEQSKSIKEDFWGMLTLCAKPLVTVFVVSIFLYVLVEQSIMSWLPTFNSRVLNMSASLSIQMASMLAAATAIGRLCAGFALQRVSWYLLLNACLFAAAGLVLLAMPMAASHDGSLVESWSAAPVAAFVFPLIGLCLAPIYPAVNSLILSSLPLKMHAAMAGLIVVFSALGGTTGSILTGKLFEVVGGREAFYFSLIPIVGLVACLYLFRTKVEAQGSPQGLSTES